MHGLDDVKLDPEFKPSPELERMADEYAARSKEIFLKMATMPPAEARKRLGGKGGVFPEMAASIINGILMAECDIHIQNTKEDGNRHNGLMPKTMRSDSLGSVEVITPRDRNGNFTPQFIKKRETFLTEQTSERIIAMYANGLTQGDISKMLEESYGIRVSKGAISEITDRVVPMMEEWQKRQLKPFYPIVWMDAVHYKVQSGDKKGDNARAIYNIIAVDCDGHMDLIGIYVDHSEGANYWRSVLEDIRGRGVSDIGIACVDGLTGFPEAIRDIFPQTRVQCCLVHQMRNSGRIVGSKVRKEVMADLKSVYHSPTREAAHDNFLTVKEKWGARYPKLIESWEKHWDGLTTFYDFPAEVKNLIYTTNPIEGYHREIRKVTKTKAIFPNDTALLKQVYLKYLLIHKRWQKKCVRDWDIAAGQLKLIFGERMKNE